MESRDFHISRRTFVRVYHNLQAMNIGLAITKSRGTGFDLPRQIRFTLAEWKSLHAILTPLVNEAMSIHRVIISGQQPPVLKESRHIISSRLMTNLSITRSAIEGTQVYLSLGAYDRHESGEVVPCLRRGVNLTLEEILGLSETRNAIGKYIGAQLSSTKVVSLSCPEDVVRLQNYVGTFYSDGLNRVRLLLEKPEPPSRRRVDGNDDVTRANATTDERVDEDVMASVTPQTPSASPAKLTGEVDDGIGEKSEDTPWNGSSVTVDDAVKNEIDKKDDDDTSQMIS